MKTKLSLSALMLGIVFSSTITVQNKALLPEPQCYYQQVDLTKWLECPGDDEVLCCFLGEQVIMKPAL